MFSNFNVEGSHAYKVKRTFLYMTSQIATSFHNTITMPTASSMTTVKTQVCKSGTQQARVVRERPTATLSTWLCIMLTHVDFCMIRQIHCFSVTLRSGIVYS
ncbi:uncharacterized protein PHALS_15406 [Plasmopara halstedii]|uniref:Uncharacterized protein n=1 Tax=Plasmopara halstedii TaxID=4781 RepID=A0A0P1AG35_PLAHL|nr:uncharacterized protein PHALS_15406 [Plasmopara halstedii]CEG39849.1 hypothetical protein PHALS_15406 [Plasmopara halstedii]|eukprot:XP_024576218.1 hypothetical protein PHALS_15406 [Plasmopara halstedii]